MCMGKRWIAIGLAAVMGSIGCQRNDDKVAETDPAQAGFAPLPPPGAR